MQVDIGGENADSGNSATEAAASQAGLAGAGTTAGEAANTDTEAILKLLESNWNLEREVIQIVGSGADTGKS
ncbi:hypothetical protein D3C75_1309640 [compost metagenome]